MDTSVRTYFYNCPSVLRVNIKQILPDLHEIWRIYKTDRSLSETEGILLIRHLEAL